MCVYTSLRRSYINKIKQLIIAMILLFSLSMWFPKTVLHQQKQRDMNIIFTFNRTTANFTFLPQPSRSYCSMKKCFDFLKCPTNRPFRFYVYNTDKCMTALLSQQILTSLSKNQYRTLDAGSACVYIVLLATDNIQDCVDSLKFWNYGYNHVVINLKNNPVSLNNSRAILAQSNFIQNTFRQTFDMVLPYFSTNDNTKAPNVFSTRKYLLTFLGNLNNPQTISHETSQGIIQENSRKIGQGASQANIHDTFRQDSYELERSVIQTLQDIQQTTLKDKVYFDFTCEPSSINCNYEWCLCKDDTKRINQLKESIFSLIVSPVDISCSIATTHSIQQRIVEALQYGAIPVILGCPLNFPFQELVHWERAVIQIPKARSSELRLLTSMQDSDITEYRKWGRMIYVQYLSSYDRILDSLIQLLRIRLNMPATSALAVAFSYMNKTQIQINSGGNGDTMEGKLSLSNHLPGADSADTGAQKDLRSLQLRHLKLSAQGVSSFYTKKADTQIEQFTIVILTVNRNHGMLMNNIARLKNLMHLNKVVIVWNNSTALPKHNMMFPDIGVPIHVVVSSTNRLSNRFIPYETIETDAVLSLDDDVAVDHDQVVFIFNVWKKNKDSIVGPHSRLATWNNTGWVYDNDYEQFNMILTGYAMFHKYYMYLFTYEQPRVILDICNELLNCEDIAMNFLIAHISRKPTIRIEAGDRPKPLCYGCKQGLSHRKGHYAVRAQCLDRFEQLYGYVPLIISDHRVTRMQSNYQRKWDIIRRIWGT